MRTPLQNFLDRFNYMARVNDHDVRAVFKEDGVVHVIDNEDGEEILRAEFLEDRVVVRHQDQEQTFPIVGSPEHAVDRARAYATSRVCERSAFLYEHRNTLYRKLRELILGLGYEDTQRFPLFDDLTVRHPQHLLDDVTFEVTRNCKVQLVVSASDHNSTTWRGRIENVPAALTAIHTMYAQLRALS